MSSNKYWLILLSTNSSINLESISSLFTFPKSIRANIFSFLYPKSMIGFLFLALVIGVTQDYQLILDIMNRVQVDTDYSSIYEMFGAHKHTSMKDIMKVYTKLYNSKKDLPKFKLPLTESKILLTNCLNVLKKQRNAYEKILNSSHLIYENSKNYTNSSFMVFASLISLLLCVDLIYFCYRFALYSNLATTEIKSKKKGKKSVILSNMSKPDMYIYKGYKKILSVFGIKK